MQNIARSLSTLRKALAFSIFFAALLALFTGSAFAQLLDASLPYGQVPKYVPGRTLRSLPGVREVQTPQVVLDGRAVLVGHYEPTQMLRLAITLMPPHPVEEGQFLEQLQDKTSPLFHQYLTPEDWTARFGPSVADEQAVADWAQSQGLSITYRSKHRMVVDVEAPAGLIEKVLGLTINKYQVPNADGTQGEIQYSEDREPSLPSRIASVVSSVQGLNSFERVYPASGRESNVVEPDYVAGPAIATQWTAHADAKPATDSVQAEASGINPSVTAPKTDFYQPSDLWSYGGYDYLALMNQGHCCNPLNNADHSPEQTSIAIAGYDPLSLSDVADFQAYFSYLSYQIETIGVDGGLTCSPSAGTCGGEASLDNEWAIATANSRGSSANTAKVYYYNAPNGDSTDVWTHIMDDSHARVMSSSWGAGEPDTSNSSLVAQDNILATMAGEGWTLLFSSGDQGSTGTCTDALKVIYPASDPNVIAVGGTTLYTSQRSEVGWTGGTTPGSCSPKNNHGGSTGGFSDVWPAPSFQNNMGFTKRSVPDMALNANVGQDVYVNNGWAYLGGTSIATPMLAGFMAQENAYLLSLGDVCGTGKQACSTLGDVNYAIYEEGKSRNTAHIPFYDIVSGCSTNDITAEYPDLVAWCAKTGFDQVTGWGSANMLQLAWAINYEDTAAIDTPSVTWSGPATGQWYNTNQNVSWKIVDNSGSSSYNGTGIAGFNQGWDSVPSDSTTEPANFSIPVAADTFFDGPQYPNAKTGCLALASGEDCSGGVSQGCHTAHVRGFNNQGYTTGDTTYGPVCYDTVAPTITASLSPTVPSSGWYARGVNVTLKATDPGGSGASGINSTGYTISPANCSPAFECNAYTAPFAFNTQGVTTISYLTLDNASNLAYGSVVIQIDETAPVTTSTISGTIVNNAYTSAVSIKLAATDALSGVASTVYTLDSGASTTYMSAFMVTTPGSHTLKFYSVDVAGNIETSHTVPFTIASPNTITVSPGMLVFASTPVGTATAAQLITLTNTGTTPITFTATTTLTGAGASSFTRTNVNCTSPLAAGASCTNSIVFKPTTTGTLTATVTYTDSSATPNQTVTLSGSGTSSGPTLSISPGSLTFATTPVGTSTAAQIITLTNTGTTPITFTAATTVTGSGTSSFTRANVNCASPLAAGASCTNSVTFTPTAAGLLSATVTYSDSGSSTPQTVALTGTGGSSAATLSVSPGLLTFASTPVGTATASQTITLTNTGTTPITFTAATTITGSGASSYTRANVNCTSPLAAGASCMNTIVFKPTASGVLTATVTYSDSGSATPQTVTLSGTGAGAATLTISPGTLTFASTAVGTSTAAQTITLTNTGTTPITFTATTTITGTGATSFSRANVNCASPLAAGASCTNTVVFKPTVTGVLSAIVTYSDSGSSIPQTVTVTGTGQ